MTDATNPTVGGETVLLCGGCGECVLCAQADARRDAAEVFAKHEGDLRFKLAEVLTIHWLTDLGCSHEGEGSNAASCWCGWTGQRVKNVGEAVTTWVNHALEEMRPILADALDSAAITKATGG
jgi:hypothetical protein